LNFKIFLLLLQDSLVDILQAGNQNSEHSLRVIMNHMAAFTSLNKSDGDQATSNLKLVFGMAQTNCSVLTPEFKRDLRTEIVKIIEEFMPAGFGHFENLLVLDTSLHVQFPTLIPNVIVKHFTTLRNMLQNVDSLLAKFQEQQAVDLKKAEEKDSLSLQEQAVPTGTISSKDDDEAILMGRPKYTTKYPRVLYPIVMEFDNQFKTKMIPNVYSLKQGPVRRSNLQNLIKGTGIILKMYPQYIAPHAELIFGTLMDLITCTKVTLCKTDSEYENEMKVIDEKKNQAQQAKLPLVSKKARITTLEDDLITAQLQIIEDTFSHSRLLEDLTDERFTLHRVELIENIMELFQDAANRYTTVAAQQQQQQHDQSKQNPLDCFASRMVAYICNTDKTVVDKFSSGRNYSENILKSLVQYITIDSIPMLLKDFEYYGSVWTTLLKLPRSETAASVTDEVFIKYVLNSNTITLLYTFF